MKPRSSLALFARLFVLLRRAIRWTIWFSHRLIHVTALAILRLQGHRISSHYHGVVVYEGVGGNQWEFPNQIVKALQFLDEHDPCRGQMVRDHLERIFDGCNDYRAQYDRGHRMCQINYQHYRDVIVGKYPIEGPTQDALTLRLASLLVHVATRGRARPRRLAYNSETQARIVRLSRLQESYYYRRVAAGRTDLVGRPVDWKTESACKPDEPGKIMVLSRSTLESLIAHATILIGQLRDRIDGAPTDQLEDFDDDESPSRRWGENDAEHAKWVNRTPLLSPNLIEKAANGFRSRGMLHAAILCFDRLHEIVRTPRSETLCYNAKLLYQTKQYELSDALWQQLEERKDMRKIALTWRSAVHRQLRHFDEAQALLERSGLDERNLGMLGQLLCIDLLRRDFNAAGERLQEMIKSGEPAPQIGDRKFWLRAVVPVIDWFRGDTAEFARSIGMILAARDRWLERQAASERWCCIIDAAEVIRQPGMIPGDIKILTRLDSEVSKEQIQPATELAIKIRQAMDTDAFSGPMGYLQGLGYGDDETKVRRIRWNRLDQADRLEGRWCVADLRVDRVFLDQGMITDQWIRMWMLPLHGGGSTDTLFVPTGCLPEPSGRPVEGAPSSFDQMRSFKTMMDQSTGSFDS